MVNWNNVGNYKPKEYTCYFCGTYVGTKQGYTDTHSPNLSHIVYICPNCGNPTYFRGTTQFPAPAFGNKVEHLPKDLAGMYKEARDCTGINAFTAAVLACRKILMHIAVEKGADPGKNFLEYIEYLSDKGYVPPDGKGWVDHIRTKANEANHEIVLMQTEDATDLITFIEMLLRFIYEFPAKIKEKPSEEQTE